MKNTLKIVALALVAVMLVCTLASCGPNKDPEKAEKALKDAGYTVSSGSLSLGLAYDGFKTAVRASKGDDQIIIYYFETSKAAKAAYQDMDDSLSKKDREEMEKENVVFKLSGAMVYVGTKQAVKDAG